MKLPRDISGEKMVAALVRNWGYVKVNQVGSHIIVQTETPVHHRLSVPNHDRLRVGTLNAILRAVSQAKSVSRDEIVNSI